jgi:hypothetical protein
MRARIAHLLSVVAGGVRRTLPRGRMPVASGRHYDGRLAVGNLGESRS